MTDEPTPTPPAVDRVTYAVDGGVATITIDAADAGNSLTSSMRDGMTELVEWASADHGVRAIWNVLSELGMAAAQDRPFEFELHRDCRRRFLAYSDGALSSTSGIIRFLVKPGDLIENGQPVAKVYNAFGKLLETVVSAHRGIVLGHSDSSVAFPGVPVVALGVLKPPARKPSTTGGQVQP